LSATLSLIQDLCGRVQVQVPITTALPLTMTKVITWGQKDSDKTTQKITFINCAVFDVSHNARSPLTVW